MNGETKVVNISILGLLGIAFVVLKLCGVIAWSWWWVTMPFWIGLAIAVVLLALIGVISLFTYLFLK